MGLRQENKAGHGFPYRREFEKHWCSGNSMESGIGKTWAQIPHIPSSTWLRRSLNFKTWSWRFWSQRVAEAIAWDSLAMTSAVTHHSASKVSNLLQLWYFLSHHGRCHLPTQDGHFQGSRRHNTISNGTSKAEQLVTASWHSLDELEKP